MVLRVRIRRPAARTMLARAGIVLAATAILGALGALSGCGSSLRNGGGEEASAADVDASTPGTCAATVLEALGRVALRVYGEGVASERTASAQHLIAGSAALRRAVEEGNARGARSAAEQLIATGHMTNLRIVRGGRVLAEAGHPGALAPLSGKLTGAGGKPIGGFVTSVWANGGLIAETNGIAEGVTMLREHEHTVAGAFELPPGELPAQGTLTHAGVAYQYTSFPATSYPAGKPLRVFLLRPISSTAALCGASGEDTTVNTISRIAHLIYDGEAGRRTLAQIHRVQQSRTLLHAVARRDPAATRAAVEKLLHHHIVRLRVSAGGRLLSDVGGPFVLAPVSAPLRLAGRTIGSFVLSIQDDEGYKRLAQRLVGLDVVMYMGSRLVRSTLDRAPKSIPTSGSLRYRGRSFRLYTFNAQAFPSGPLRITVLIPLPYS
jgi:hypothetical protein